MVNIATRPTEKSMAVVNCSRPPYIVASQLRIFTPVGTAMNIVDSEKAMHRDRARCPRRTCGAPTRPSP